MDIATAAVSADMGRTPSGPTNAYVLGHEDALLVDPAADHEDIDELLTDRTVGHVAVTHCHRDHVGGVAAYAERCDATLWARTGREGRFRDATGVAPDRTFREGTVIPAGDGPVTVLDTPGHAPEHVAFEVPAADGRHPALVTGDLAVEPGTVVVGAPEGDMRAYLTSLRRTHARDPARLYPGHGAVIDDPRATLQRLVDHRRDREARVLAAVEGGARTVDAVLEEAYEKDLTGVRDLAAATVRAHLDKLESEGHVEWDGAHADPR